MALFDGSITGAKYCPNSHGPCSNSLKHCVDSLSCAVPGGHRHSAVMPFTE